MKSYMVCLLALAAVVAARPEEASYTTKFDNVDVEEIIKNHRLLQGYVNCALEKGKCTAEGKEVKAHIKDALETYCDKCNDVQKDKVRIVIRHLVNHEPAFWSELTAKYDPTNKYTKKYEDELKTLKA